MAVWWSRVLFIFQAVLQFCFVFFFAVMTCSCCCLNTVESGSRSWTDHSSITEYTHTHKPRGNLEYPMDQNVHILGLWSPWRKDMQRQRKDADSSQKDVTNSPCCWSGIQKHKYCILGVDWAQIGAFKETMGHNSSGYYIYHNFLMLQYGSDCVAVIILRLVPAELQVFLI